MSDNTTRYLLIADQEEFPMLESSIGTFGECERLDIATVSDPLFKGTKRISNRIGAVIFIFALIWLASFLLRIPTWLTFLVFGAYGCWALLSSIHKKNSIHERVLRFYSCQNHLLWTYNRIFNRKSRRVALVSANSVPPSKWEAFADLSLNKLQGVPSLLVLIVSLKSKSLDSTAFDAGFDYTIEAHQINELPEFVLRHYNLVGRNRVSKWSIAAGLLYGIVASLCLGIASGLGSKGAEWLWRVLKNPYQYWLDYFSSEGAEQASQLAALFLM